MEEDISARSPSELMTKLGKTVLDIAYCSTSQPVRTALQTNSIDEKGLEEDAPWKYSKDATSH